ncbi:MAG: DUF4238 domain-containing protein [Candidatus Omnitrophica bacterium]|nr:DUF4238 domain-containing protein [Candidatus Omnitrophota bacterium]
MAKHSFPKNQHYVPQSILKGFAHGKKKKVWAYDKHTDNIFETQIRNIAAETGFYDISGKELSEKLMKDDKFEKNDLPQEVIDFLKTGNYTITMEEKFNKLEDKAASIVEKMIKADAISGLTEEEKVIFGLFLAVQQLRVKVTALQIRQMFNGIKEHCVKMGFTEGQIDKSMAMDKTDLKMFHLRTIMKADRNLPQFLNKKWILLKAPERENLYIGDNPVTLQNQNDYSPYGNLGLAVKGIEIYFPISHKYELALFCPSIEEAFLELEDKLKEFPHYEPKIGRAYLNEMIEGFKSGRSVTLQREMVENLNYLQVMFSCRFVFSQSNNFEIVRKMIENREEYRGFLKMEWH